MKLSQLLFVVLMMFGCKGKSDLNTPEVEKSLETIAREVIIDAKYCTLITTDNLGLFYARPMDPFLPEEDFTIWMATNPKSSKVEQLDYNPRSTLYYFDPNKGAYVTLQGITEIVDSPDIKQKYWKKEWQNFYKNKTTDFLLLKFKPSRGFLISEEHHIFGDSITWAAPKLNF